MSESRVTFTCDQCDKTYVMKHHFDNHMKSRHSEHGDATLAIPCQITEKKLSGQIMHFFCHNIKIYV